MCVLRALPYSKNLDKSKLDFYQIDNGKIFVRILIITVSLPDFCLELFYTASETTAGNFYFILCSYVSVRMSTA